MTLSKTPYERIIAFIDGELTGDELSLFERQLESDPSLADEVVKLMTNDAIVREASGQFAQPIARYETDEVLLARMGLMPQAAIGDGEVVDFRQRRATNHVANDNTPFWQSWAVPIGGALAATFTAIAIFGTSGGASTTSFNDALQVTPSRQSVIVESGAVVTPLLTFAAGGIFCREFSIAKSNSNGGSGIACNRGGEWKIEAIEKGAVDLADPDTIQLASGANGTLLDVAYAKLGASDPIDASSERSLIDNGWKRR